MAHHVVRSLLWVVGVAAAACGSGGGVVNRRPAPVEPAPAPTTSSTATAASTVTLGCDQGLGVSITFASSPGWEPRDATGDSISGRRRWRVGLAIPSEVEAAAWARCRPGDDCNVSAQLTVERFDDKTFEPLAEASSYWGGKMASAPTTPAGLPFLGDGATLGGTRSMWIYVAPFAVHVLARLPQPSDGFDFERLWRSVVDSVARCP